MTKKISYPLNLAAACVFFVIILICSGIGHASPSTSLTVTSAESQVEIVEMSAWPRIRDGLLGRNRYRNPPLRPPHDFHGRRHHGRPGHYPPPRGSHHHRH